MAIRRWHPEGEIGGLSRFIDDVIDEFVQWPLSIVRERRGLIIPPIDVTESSGELTVKTELPGMDKKDIKLALEGNILTISGEKKEEKEEKEKNYYLIERRFGSFSRSVTLPVGIDPDKIKAAYKDGILTVTIPKSEEAKAKRIEVKGE